MTRNYINYHQLSRLYYGWAHPYFKWENNMNHVFRAHFLGDAFEMNNVDSTKSYIEKFRCQETPNSKPSIKPCNITGVRAQRGFGDRWRFRRIDEQFLIFGKDLVKDLIKRPYCHKNTRTCTTETVEKFNYGTDYGGTSVMYWLMGLAKEKGVFKTVLGGKNDSEIFEAVIGNAELLTWQDNLKYREHPKFFMGDDVSLCDRWLTMHRADERQMVYLYEKEKVLKSGGKWDVDFEEEKIEDKLENKILGVEIIKS